MRTLKFLNQKGMTLAEIMIAAALMGAVALITAKLMGDQTSNQAYLKAKAEVSSTVTKVESLLNNPKQCSYMMEGKLVSAAGTPISEIILKVERGAALESVSVIKEGKYQAFEIEAGGIKLQNSIYGASVTDLVLTFKMKGKSFFTGSAQREIVKKIPFVTQLDASSKIMGCGPVLGDSELVGQKKMCQSLIDGGIATWDGDGPCKLKDVKCDRGFVATKMTSLGGIICTRLENQIPLGDIFNLDGMDCTGMPNLQIVNVNGKLKIVCTAGACTPVNGGWSAWSNPTWSTCSSGTQTRTRVRTCNSPAPNACGASCSGSTTDPQSQACGCTPSCSGAPASMICSGYTIAGDDDGCGGTCPSTSGTNPNTCASGLCLCTPALNDGTVCSNSPGSSGLPNCNKCENVPLNDCACGANPSTKATCGQISNCSAWGMCNY